MISLYTGKIGSGKTLLAIGRIVRHVAAGGIVYTNIAISFPALRDLCRRRFRVYIEQDQIRPLDMVNDPRWHVNIEWGAPGSDDPAILVVLDEIHLFFNARDWAKTHTLHRDMLSFLSQSRKARVDVVFIAQVAATLEKQFRDQCEWQFYCRNVKDIKVPFFGNLPLNRMLLVKRDVETDTAVSREFIGYDKSLFPVYDTLSFLDGQMQEASAAVVRVPRRKLRRVSIFTGPRLVALVALLVVAAYYLITSPS